MMKKTKNKSRTIKFQDTEFYFDNCAICQAMKQAEDRGGDLSESELKAAFKKAKNKGAVVGGKLFEKESN